MELKSKFEEIQGERNVKDITALDLDNVKSPNFEGLPDELPEVLVMNASGLGLENLNGLPRLPKLQTLDLSENKLTGAVLGVLGEKCPTLEQLNLCGNQIVDLDSLKPLMNLKTLATLDLLENEITKVENYRDEVFKLMPHLSYLDGFDCNNEELCMGSDDGESVDAEDVDDEDDEEEVGLSYLDSSKCLEEDDDSPDFQEGKSRKRKNDEEGEATAEKQAKGDA